MIVDEFLDIVDQSDNVIGQSRRSDVHQRGFCTGPSIYWYSMIRGNC